MKNSSGVCGIGFLFISLFRLQVLLRILRENLGKKHAPDKETDWNWSLLFFVFFLLKQSWFTILCKLLVYRTMIFRYSVARSCLTCCDPRDCSTPSFSLLHHILEFTQTHVHWVSKATQPSHPLSSPSPAFKLSQHQGLLQWVSSSHHVAKVL